MTTAMMNYKPIRYRKKTQHMAECLGINELFYSEMLDVNMSTGNRQLTLGVWCFRSHKSCICFPLSVLYVLAAEQAALGVFTAESFVVLVWSLSAGMVPLELTPLG